MVCNFLFLSIDCLFILLIVSFAVQMLCRFFLAWCRLSDFTFIYPFHELQKEMATHSSVLVWRIPGTGEPGRLPSMGSHRVRHDWSDLAAAAVLLLCICFCCLFFMSYTKNHCQDKYQGKFLLYFFSGSLMVSELMLKSNLFQVNFLWVV